MQPGSADVLPPGLKKLWLYQLEAIAGPGKQKNNPHRLISKILYDYGPLIKQLWDSYNFSESRQVKLRVTERSFALSYVLAFHPNNLQRNVQILRRIQRESDFFSSLQKPLHILDLGCGAGAWSASFLDFLTPSQRAETAVHLVDRSRYFLDSARDGIEAVYKVKEVRTLAADLRDEKVEIIVKKILDNCKKQDGFLVLGLSYVWNEIKDPRSQKKVLRVIESILKAPIPLAFHLSEPGREMEAREAQGFREWLLDFGMTFLYPCPQSLSCPMLDSSKDWCFSEVEAPRLREWEEVGKFLKLRRQKVAVASYFALNVAAMTLVSSNLKALPTERIVGFPEVQDRFQTLTCNGERLKKWHVYSPQMKRGQIFDRSKE